MPTPQYPALPITKKEYTKLKRNSLEVYKYGDPDNPFYPLQVNPTIKLSALMNYFETNKDELSGIRIYPAFSSGKLFFIMCIGNEDDNQNEKAYLLLENNLYLQDDSLPSINDQINMPRAQNLHSTYNSEINIGATSPNSVRRSRFYFWNELEALISQNLPSGNYDKHLVKFEFGFVDTNLAEVFQSRIDFGNIEFHKGFTVLIHLLDEHGNSLLDPTAPYGTGNYQNRALEVGHPCPPRCGVLHQ